MISMRYHTLFRIGNGMTTFDLKGRAFSPLVPMRLLWSISKWNLPVSAPTFTKRAD